MKKEDIEKAKALIAQAQKIAVVCHYNPDGDAIGSTLALYNYMENEGKIINAVLPNRHPEFLDWMPGIEDAIIAEEQPEKAKVVLNDADLIFIVDMNAAHRAGKSLEPVISQAKGHRILIDHHVSPEIDCDVMYSSIETTSSCELVYHFLYDYLDSGEKKLSLAIAQCLYVGIITDTGSLTYSCNYPETYTVIEKLIRRGVDGEDIHRKVYDNYSENRMRLLGLLLSQRMNVISEKSTSYTWLTDADLKANNYKQGDTEGFVNYGLSIKGIRFTAFFSDRKDHIHISFRSKGTFDVNLFARKYFNGGGHRNASAANYYDTLQNAIERFEKALEDYEGELY